MTEAIVTDNVLIANGPISSVQSLDRLDLRGEGDGVKGGGRVMTDDSAEILFQSLLQEQFWHGQRCPLF